MDTILNNVFLFSLGVALISIMIVAPYSLQKRNPPEVIETICSVAIWGVIAVLVLKWVF